MKLVPDACIAGVTCEADEAESLDVLSADTIQQQQGRDDNFLET